MLWHPDPGRIGEPAALPELAEGGEVELSRLAPLFANPGDESRRPLEDSHVSRQPVRLRQRAGAIEIDPSGSRTAVEADGEPLGGPRRIPSEDLSGGRSSSSPAIWSGPPGSSSALRIAPGNPQAAYEAALIYTLVGDRTSALASAETALRGGVQTRGFGLPWFRELRTDPQLQDLLGSGAPTGQEIS